MKAWVEFWSKGNDDEVEQKMENWMSAFQERIELDNERANIWKCGMRWAVETRRKERTAQQEQRRQREKGQNSVKVQEKTVQFREEEQYEEVQARNTETQDVMSGIEESTTGRGSTSLIRGGGERSQANEIRGKGKGKGNGGKGEHGGKDEKGGKGIQQGVKMLKGEEDSGGR